MYIKYYGPNPPSCHLGFWLCMAPVSAAASDMHSVQHRIKHYFIYLFNMPKYKYMLYPCYFELLNIITNSPPNFFFLQTLAVESKEWPLHRQPCH